jgi:hypothetical protein
MGATYKETGKVTNQTLTLAELAGGIEQVLQAVAEQQVTITVLLPSGKEVVIEAKAELQPLPELEGHVPEGWKAALYARS